MSTNERSNKKRRDEPTPSRAAPERSSPGTSPEIWLLERLDEAGKNGMSPDEILAAMEDRAGRESLPSSILLALEHLQERGLVTEWARRWYRIRQTDWLVGRIGRGLEEGVVEVRSIDPLAPSWSAKQDHLKRARRGDLVLLKSLRSAGSRRAENLGEVSVVRVLSRARSTMVGMVRRGDERWQFVPFDGSGDFEVSSEDAMLDQASPGVYFTARVIEARSARARGRAKAGRGRSREPSWETVELVERLGEEDQPGVDVDVILRHFDIPDAFPPEVLAQAESFPDAPETRGLSEGPALVPGKRIDLRALTTVTIDGESARDFDDAISVQDLAGGRLRLGVHVADVAEYVTDQSPLDREAERRGTSVYLPDRVIPMLPEKLSNGLCSLNPAVPRFALSVFLEFDREGTVVATDLSETLIESDARLTYDQVAGWLDAWDSGGVVDTGQSKGVEQTLRCADLLVKRLLERRSERGSLDFDFPVSRVEVDSEGRPVSVEPEVRNRAHRLIEEFMVAANAAIARTFVEREIAAMFRRHDPPSLSRIEEMSQQLERLGLTVEEDAMAELFQAVGESPLPLRRLQETVAGLPEEDYVGSLILMSLQRAIYHPKNSGHYALGLEHYCHFTSPIRRYPDLLVHRQLKRILRLQPPMIWSRDRVYAMADHCSMTEQRAERAERELSQWKKVRWLARRLGEHFMGRVTGVQPFGLFVQLEDVLVDGLLPISSLGDDYYVFDPDRLLLEGSNRGRVFRLADRLEVTVDSINEERRGVVLTLTELDRPDRDGRSQGPRRRTEPRRERTGPKGERGASRKRRR